jgi:tRNA U38,U39,U40 pseudouridine synthase TruA
MRNVKLTVAYDGTDFTGWQIQPGQVTIPSGTGFNLSGLNFTWTFINQKRTG